MGYHHNMTFYFEVLQVVECFRKVKTDCKFASLNSFYQSNHERPVYSNTHV